MNEFESDWISLSRHPEWSESVFEWIWEKITRCLNPRWQCLNPTWQNSKWLPSLSWVRMNEWIFFVQNGWIQHGRILDGCHHQVESEWMSEVFLCKWWEPILASVSEFERKYYNGWIQDGQIPDGRIQDGCHHQVKWEWMSLSQIELVWVSIRVEWEYFWVNLREDNKVSESKMAVSKSNMAEFKMAIIINLSQNEWVKFFCANVGNQSWQVWVSLRGNTIMAESKMAKFKMVEFKMAAIIKLSENEWAWVRLN